MHSMLLAHWAITVRMLSAYRAHIQRMHSMWLARGTNGPCMKRAWCAHDARMQSALNAQPANGSGQMTVPIQKRRLVLLAVISK